MGGDSMASHIITPTLPGVINQSTLGGGGYITGLIQHPSQAHILFARCDVGGVFKSMDAAQTWRTVNKGMTESHHHSVQSFAISPHNPDLLLRCSGEARGQRRIGTIHRSDNGGESWYAVCSNVDYYGNGPTRMHAEVIAFDPFDSRFAATGGYSNGVWVSDDAGEHWKYAGLNGERITSLYYHPLRAGVIYAGTASDIVLKIKDQGKRWANEDMAHKLTRFGDFARGDRGRLFRSDNGGRAWGLVCEGYDFVDLAFDRENANKLYLATLQHGIRTSEDSGSRWHELTNGLPTRMAYNTITVRADNVLYTAPDARPQHSHLPAIPVYRSTDSGETWELVHEHTAADFHNYPAYMSARHAGWAISTLLPDSAEPGRMYLCNWYGVARSDDGGKTWDAHGFSGIETTCVESIQCDPTLAGHVYITLGDHRPTVSTDNGKSYRMLTLEHIVDGSAASDSNAFVASKHRPGLLLAGMTNRGDNPQPCAIIRSTDGGLTGEQVAFFPPGLFVQALVEDPHQPGRFYAYLEGRLRDGAGVYCSGDWGTYWHKLPLGFPSYIQTLPHNAHWVESELLSVVVYQIKNVCGTNKLLAADPHQTDTLYLGEWTEGVFRVTEGGRRVERRDVGLPFGAQRSAALVALKADEQHPGVLYAGFIAEGLWRSEDYGATWHKLYPRENRLFNASAVDVQPDLIVIASEPLYWSPSRSAVILSSDYGATWHDIYDPALGALRWKGIAVDRSRGVIHGCTCGNGCYTFSL